MSADATGAASAEPQAVATELTSAAVFLVVVLNPGTEADQTARALLADLAGLIRAVGFRVPDGRLTCVAGLSDGAWDRLAWPPRPAGLHPFTELHADGRHAPATPGDLMFHIRATRMDLCFELATQIVARLDGVGAVADEVHGFRYFEQRDLLGFVDGTENPVGRAAQDAAIIGAEDPDFAGGSYVIIQKYLHDLAAWNQLPTEQQERVIGRTKLADIELSDDAKPSWAHNALTSIEHDGEELQIVRDNMPFGSVGSAEFGTYFIGYARSPAVIEEMLVNMFVGKPEGNYDRILDVSRAVTGGLYFVPSATLLEALADGPPEHSTGPGTAGRPAGDRGQRGPGLEIGSLRGASQDE
jgi:putative iron-dependent peroxidase